MRLLPPLLLLLACCAASAVPSPGNSGRREGWRRGGCDGFSFEVPPAFRKADAKTHADLVRSNVLPALDGTESEVWFAGPASAPKSAVVFQAQWDAGKTPEQIASRIALLMSLPKELVARGLGEEIKARGWEIVSCSPVKPAKLGGLEGATVSVSCKLGNGPETAAKNYFAHSGNLTFTLALVYRKEESKQAAPVLKQVLESVRVGPVPGLVRAAKPVAPLAPLPVAAKGTLLVAEGDFGMRIPAGLDAGTPPPDGFRRESGTMRTRLGPGNPLMLAETGKPEPEPGKIGTGRAFLTVVGEDVVPANRHEPTEDYPFLLGLDLPEIRNLAKTLLENQMAAYRQAGAAIDPRLERMGLLSFDGAEARTAAGGVRVVKIAGTAVWFHLHPARFLCYVVQNRDRAYTFWCAYPVEEEAKWEPLFDGALGSIRPAAR